MSQHKQDEYTRWGLLGVIPLLVAAVAVWLSPLILPQHIALDFAWGALIYLGVIIGFLSGVGAGLELHPQNSFRTFLPYTITILAVVILLLPSGVFIFATPMAWRFVGVIVLLLYILMRDVNATAQSQAPGWYGPLRIRLTFWAGMSATMIAIRLAFWRFY